jgi:hypothetical protein
MNRTKTRTALAALTAGTSLVLAAGCSQRYAAERDGKKIGQAVCDLRRATTAEEADAARAEVVGQIDDLSSKVALHTAEDRRDVEANLADLAEHAVQGNEMLAQQDIAVLDRSARHIAEDANEVSRAAWEGVAEGLADCTT